MDRRLAPISVLVLGSASCEERPYFRDPAALVCFANPLDCTAKPAGTRARNPAYARTLAAIALRGADAFYTGAIADGHPPHDADFESWSGCDRTVDQGRIVTISIERTVKAEFG